MAYDLDSPNAIAHLKTRIRAEEANLRGLETYHRGAKWFRLSGWLSMALAAYLWVAGSRNMAAGVLAYGLLAEVTHFLFAPLLIHYCEAARGNIDELRANLLAAEGRHRESP